MRPELQQAIALLQKATGMLQLNRQDHQQIIEAINLINTELTKKAEKVEKKK